MTQIHQAIKSLAMPGVAATIAILILSLASGCDQKALAKAKVESQNLRQERDSLRREVASLRSTVDGLKLSGSRADSLDRLVAAQTSQSTKDRQKIRDLTTQLNSAKRDLRNCEADNRNLAGKPQQIIDSVRDNFDSIAGDLRSCLDDNFSLRDQIATINFAQQQGVSSLRMLTEVPPWGLYDDQFTTNRLVERCNEAENALRNLVNAISNAQ